MDVALIFIRDIGSIWRRVRDSSCRPRLKGYVRAILIRTLVNMFHCGTVFETKYVPVSVIFMRGPRICLWL